MKLETPSSKGDPFVKKNVSERAILLPCTSVNMKKKKQTIR